jgi:hypothetical protein
MMYEADRSSRRQALAGTAIGLGTMAAMGKFNGLASLLKNVTTDESIGDIANIADDIYDPDFSDLNDPFDSPTPSALSAIAMGNVPAREIGDLAGSDPRFNAQGGMRSFGGNFNSAFRQARQAGLDTFEWNGKRYTTRRADDPVEPRGTAATPTGVGPATPTAPETQMGSLTPEPAMGRNQNIVYTAEGPEAVVTASRLFPQQTGSSVSPQTRQEDESFFGRNDRPLQQLADNLSNRNPMDDFTFGRQQGQPMIPETPERPRVDLRTPAPSFVEPEFGSDIADSEIRDVDQGLAQSMRNILVAMDDNLTDESLKNLMLRYIQAGFEPDQVSMVVRSIVPMLMKEGRIPSLNFSGLLPQGNELIQYAQ